jgi:hypothetical protein
MQANVRVKAKEDMDKQKEKERKREQKELRKIAAANGIKMAKTPSTLATVPVPESGSLATGPGMSMEIDGGSSVAEPSKTGGGWASLSASQGSQGGFKKSGWATIGPSSSNSQTQSTSAIERQQVPAQTALSKIPRHHNPTFRNAGWSSLDTGSSQPFPATYQTSDRNLSSHGGSFRDESGSSQRWHGFPPPPEPGASQSFPPMPPLPPNNL